MNLFVLLLLPLMFLSMAKGRHLVGFREVLKLAECHKQFDYYRRMPKFNEIMDGLRQSGTKEQMEHYLGPHNQIRVEIDGCMEKNIPELYDFKKSILNEIGINKWLDSEKKWLEGEYERIGKKKRKNFDNIFETMTLNDWRRMLMAFGMAVENFALAFTKAIIGHFFHAQKDHFPQIEQKTVENLEYLKERMDNQIGSNLKILKMSGYLHHYMREKDNWLKNFNEMMEELNEKLASEIGIHPHSSADEVDKTFKFELPRIKTVFWVIRHSERFDQKLCPDCKKESKKREFILDKNGNEFGLDNSPLSEFGKKIAERLLKIFESVKISEAYSSPYFRTLQTLDRLLGPKNLHKLAIKLELAFVEGIRAKRWKDVSKLSYKSCEELNEGKIIKFNNEMNCNYISKVKREELAQEVNGYSELPKEIIEGDFSLLPLIVKALKAILLEEKPSSAHHQHFPHVKNHWWMVNGEENAEHIVITTHASVIIAMQQLFAGKFMPIPPTSITKIVEIEGGREGDGKEGVLDNFRMIFESMTSHLADIEDSSFFQ